ncbi:DUF2520 domain-containing protein [Labilibaculum sp. DW002]|uniref:DUF2520 domain-containing protein n=1 Tax=Paralabilibaculum antarcticum TaxID=2912572 RepID=A0ABT5VX81_9BACT|nr:DUF2520 domain-containing protein [Labilibaculum sp. DW002]MDE5418904.1 DUF2520 domain-containing protein [Labilibaculum sp. DW002]
MIEKIVIIGAGNLATQLSLALHEKGLGIIQVYSRTIESASELAGKVNAEASNSLQDIKTNADLYILAVSDKALQSVLNGISIPKAKLVHTAGSISVDVFKDYTDTFGVFYPLQTFSKNRKVDFSNIPICIEANQEAFAAELFELGRKISSNLHAISSDQRKQLHLAAVFTCNFANHMYSIGQELLAEKNVDFNLLQPLIKETAEKITELDPIAAQTGPAVRFDEDVIKAHEESLNMHPDFQKLYRFVSQSIYKMHSSIK